MALIKRKFGMHHLNITQGRYNAYSHSGLNAYDLAGADGGIDYVYATCDLEVVGMLMYETSGFANTIMFYDKESDVTISLSHDLDNDENNYIGKVYHAGQRIYEEGTQSAKGATKPTGNHVHMELSAGLQRTKVKVNGIWRLPQPLNIEDYYYLDETITIKNDGGYGFEIRKNEMSVKEKYTKLIWNGKTIHCYRQTKDMKIGLMSADSVATIDKIDDERIHYCKVNAGYFDLTSGEHYGVELSATKHNLTRNTAYEVVFLNETTGMIDYCNASEFTDEWFNVIKPAKWAVSPWAIMFHDHSDTDIRSIGYPSKYNTANTQTMLIQLDDKTIVLAVAESKLTPKECVRWALEYFGNDLYHVSFYDSGGSSQMRSDGVNRLYTGRKIANVLTLYKTSSDATKAEDKAETKPQEEDYQQAYLKEVERNKVLQDELNAKQETIDTLAKQVAIYKNAVKVFAEALNEIGEE